MTANLPALRWPGPLARRDAQAARPMARGAGETEGKHPAWCAGGHHCTALRLGAGEHASIPEVWRTPVGRIVATRYRRRTGTRDRIEIRVGIDLDPGDDALAQEQARVAITAVYLALTELTAPDGRSTQR